MWRERGAWALALVLALVGWRFAANDAQAARDSALRHQAEALEAQQDSIKAALRALRIAENNLVVTQTALNALARRQTWLDRRLGLSERAEAAGVTE